MAPATSTTLGMNSPKFVIVAEADKLGLRTGGRKQDLLRRIARHQRMQERRKFQFPSVAYLTEPGNLPRELHCDGDYALIDDIRETFEYVKDLQRPTTHADNILRKTDKRLMYNVTDASFVLRSNDDDDDDDLRKLPKVESPTIKYASHWEVISSATLLYRLLCVFPGVHVETQEIDDYKQVWEITGIKHKASGYGVGFYDYKGSWSLMLDMDAKDCEGLVKLEPSESAESAESARYIEDVLELLNVLAAGNCPHPYDGVVAGLVA